ncbi:uncharacterized protein LOC141899345 [Tubulanus polymorphus]|uniref:uncharacterized protein LOC141899345 n=1 Tax=Tubulanus polymorphus TaxID=672921 RepID=UPI003DA6173B
MAADPATLDKIDLDFNFEGPNSPPTTDLNNENATIYAVNREFNDNSNNSVQTVDLSVQHQIQEDYTDDTTTPTTSTRPINNTVEILPAPVHSNPNSLFQQPGNTNDQTARTSPAEKDNHEGDASKTVTDDDAVIVVNVIANEIANDIILNHKSSEIFMNEPSSTDDDSIIPHPNTVDRSIPNTAAVQDVMEDEKPLESDDEDFDVEILNKPTKQADSDSDEFEVPDDLIQKRNEMKHYPSNDAVPIIINSSSSTPATQCTQVGIGFLSGPTINEDVDLTQIKSSSRAACEMSVEGDLGLTEIDLAMRDATDHLRNSTDDAITTTPHIDNSVEHKSNNSLSSPSLELPVPLGLVAVDKANLIAGEDKKDLEAAQAEWDSLQTVTPGIVCSPLVKTTPTISFKEALDFFKTSDILQRFRSQIQPTVHRSSWGSFKHMLFGPPKLHKDLLIDRDLIFCLAACPFDNQQEVHFRILQTLYKRLTGSKFDCQRYGDHWEQIGFQGSDPSTDLRGTGLLGLLTLLYIVMNPQTLPLARDIYKLSIHEVQNFPFCVMGINMTRIVLHTLRDECMNKECNKQNDVIGLFNHLFVATYFHLYHIWKTQHKNISHSGFVINDVERFVKKNYKGAIQNLENHLKQRQAASAPTPTEFTTGMSFKGVTDLEPHDEDDADLV